MISTGRSQAASEILDEKLKYFQMLYVVVPFDHLSRGSADLIERCTSAKGALSYNCLSSGSETRSDNHSQMFPASHISSWQTHELDKHLTFFEDSYLIRLPDQYLGPLTRSQRLAMPCGGFSHTTGANELFC